MDYVLLFMSKVLKYMINASMLMNRVKMCVNKGPMFMN